MVFKRMKLYNFSLIITAPTVDDETAANKLYDAGCDDATFSFSNGTYEVEFDRKANSLGEAILSATKDVKSAEIGSQIIEIIQDDLEAYVEMRRWWYVYMVVTAMGNLYTGITISPNRRVYEHNHTKKGAKCLVGQRPVKLVWLSEKMSKSMALKMECKIKKISRIGKICWAMRDCIISHEEFNELLWPKGE